MQNFLFTTFLAADPAQSCRQPDGVVTHPNRPPYHFRAEDVLTVCRTAGFQPDLQPTRLPRGQILCIARPAR